MAKATSFAVRDMTCVAFRIRVNTCLECICRGGCCVHHVRMLRAARANVAR
jgi:hypothetical protein